MNTQHQAVFDMIRAIAQASATKTKRAFADFFADRIIQACTEPTILAAMERLAKTVDVQISEIYQPVLVQFMASINQGKDVLHWLRQYPIIAAMLVTLKKDDYLQAIKELQIEAASEKAGVAPAPPPFDIPITIQCLSPFGHGGDNKAGNATLFRRQTILCETGAILDLPFYAGNALRGTMRDLLADHFLATLGFTPRRDKPPINLWFFHVIYAGGVLEESGAALNAIAGKLGKNGAANAGGIHEFRDTLPHLSLLGAAIGNRILSGRVSFGDYRPRCVEYGNGGKYSHELFEWTFITRREDHEAHEEHHGMIANTECLRTGVIMDGGINLSDHISNLEKSALGMGLKLLADGGRIGAENRRGLGSVNIKIDNMPDPDLYQNYLGDKKKQIIKYLGEIDAIPSGQLDLLGN